MIEIPKEQEHARAGNATIAVLRSATLVHSRDPYTEYDKIVPDVSLVVHCSRLHFCVILRLLRCLAADRVALNRNGMFLAEYDYTATLHFMYVIQVQWGELFTVY